LLKPASKELARQQFRDIVKLQAEHFAVFSDKPVCPKKNLENFKSYFYFRRSAARSHIPRITGCHFVKNQSRSRFAERSNGEPRAILNFKF
jgi:hypothetical protein